MAILEKTPRKEIIDLTGPKGNAFYLLGTAANLMKTLEYTSTEAENVLTEMRSSDYENLVTLFNNHFGEIVDLER